MRLSNGIMIDCPEKLRYVAIVMKRGIIAFFKLVLIALFCAAFDVRAADSAGVGAAGAAAAGADSVQIVKEGEWGAGKKIDFKFNGLNALVVIPKNPRADRAWVWRPAFFGAFPNVDKMLLERGFHLAYCDFTHDYGNPNAVDMGRRFQNYMVKTYRLNPLVTLEGLSRGGAYSINYAKKNADAIACLYLDAPVCNFASWPSVKSKMWKDVCAKWGVEQIENPLEFEGNPYKNLEPIAKAKIPVWIVAGDSDKTVPHTENCMLFIKNYKALGGEVSLTLKPGCDHHPHGLKDPTPTVEFIEGVYGKLAK